MNTLLILAQTQEFDPSGAADKIRGALIAFLAVGLALASLWGIFLYAGKGNASRAGKMVLTCIICLIPAAIAAPLAFGYSITNWIGW